MIPSRLEVASVEVQLHNFEFEKKQRKLRDVGSRTSFQKGSFEGSTFNTMSNWVKILLIKKPLQIRFIKCDVFVCAV